MLPAARLQELREALIFGDSLDERARLDILAFIETAARSVPRSRGRPIDQQLRDRAAVVGVLHEKHGMKLELALNVVARADGPESLRRSDRERLKVAYRKLKASGARIVVSEQAVRRAINRRFSSPSSC